MLKAKGNEVLDETGKQMCVVLATSCTKRDAKRWAQYIVDRVNADERGKAFTKETLGEHDWKCHKCGRIHRNASNYDICGCAETACDAECRCGHPKAAHVASTFTNCDHCSCIDYEPDRGAK